MNCKRVIECSNYYFENKLDKEERMNIEEHLSICTKCSNHYNNEKHLFHMLSKDEIISLPHDFTDNILRETKKIRDKRYKKQNEYFIPALARSMVMAGVLLMALNFTSINIYSNYFYIFKITSDINNLFMKYIHNLSSFLSIL